MSKERAEQIFNNVVEAMQEADEIEGVEGWEYVWLMRKIRGQASKRIENCINNMEVNK
jgi:hypothetical protein